MLEGGERRAELGERETREVSKIWEKEERFWIQAIFDDKFSTNTV